jgi:hypothetical protein
LDGQDLFLEIDSAYRAAQAMVEGGDGIAVGIQTLSKRLHESGRLKAVDGRRGKLKVRRILCNSRLEVLHLHADALEQPVAENPAQSAHLWAPRIARAALTTGTGSP